MILGYEFRENFRPDWLNGLELDFYYPKLRLGIEFQGDQHFVPTERFGSCTKQRDRDRIKFYLCAAEEVTLVRLRAIDLRFVSIRSKLRRVNIRMFRKPLRSIRKALDREAKAYRRSLVEKFDSVTAVSGNNRKLAKRRQISRFLVSKGLNPLPPRTTRADIRPTKIYTKQEIEAMKSPRGGYTRQILKSMGVPWPPPRHWQRTLMQGPPPNPDQHTDLKPYMTL